MNIKKPVNQPKTTIMLSFTPAEWALIDRAAAGLDRQAYLKGVILGSLKGTGALQGFESTKPTAQPARPFSRPVGDFSKAAQVRRRKKD